MKTGINKKFYYYELKLCSKSLLHRAVIERARLKKKRKKHHKEQK